MKLAGEIVRDTQGDTTIPLIGIATYGVIEERVSLFRVWMCNFLYSILYHDWMYFELISSQSRVFYHIVAEAVEAKCCIY